MLAVTRAEILDYLKATGQAWREDHTNADVSRWRARLRAEVLPVLEAIRPGAGKKATAFTDQLRSVHRVLDDQIDMEMDLVERGDGVATLERATAMGMRRAVLSGLLRRLLLDAGVPGDKLGAKPVGAVVRAVMDGEGGERSFAFAGGVTVSLTRDQITVGTPR